MLDGTGRRFPTADPPVTQLGGTRLPGGSVLTMNGASWGRGT
ncbi:hypothetical protein [Streptomyces sp. NPDC056160]